MRDTPKYDPSVPKNYYDSFGTKEWTRLTRDRPGELLYHVHMHVFRQYINRKTSVLELGAGAGIYSKELAGLAGSLVVSDISKEQLAINQAKMTELGVAERILGFQLLDIADLNGVDNNQYDVVTCVGAALNYTFDKERAAVAEMLRVTKPGGLVIVGVAALFNSIMHYLSAIVDEKKQFGINATRWLMESGIQDVEHYPVANGNYMRMMRSRDLDMLFEGQNAQVVEKRAAGVFTLAGDEALEQAKADSEFWNLLLEKELDFSKDPAYLDCGANLIYVARKIQSERS